MSAFQAKDRNALTNLFSSSEHLQYIGSDVEEVWSGDLVRAAYGDHVEESPDSTINCTRIEAYESGTVGWASWFGDLHFDGMPNSEFFRISWVFVLEHGVWKIVQMHLSNPKPNLEVMGAEHSAFYRLIESAKDNYQHIEGEETATVMFTDIVNSTSIADMVGDRSWASTIKDHLEALSRLIDDNGGIVIKTLGDGTIGHLSLCSQCDVGSSSYTKPSSKLTSRAETLCSHRNPYR